jgi:hypothetical protein
MCVTGRVQILTSSRNVFTAQLAPDQTENRPSDQVLLNETDRIHFGTAVGVVHVALKSMAGQSRPRQDTRLAKVIWMMADCRPACAPGYRIAIKSITI